MCGMLERRKAVMLVKVETLLDIGVTSPLDVDYTDENPALGMVIGC